MEKKDGDWDQNFGRHRLPEPVLSRICRSRPTWWLPADYFDKQQSDDNENGIAAEAIKTGWEAVPWYRYQSALTHYVAQQFGIGLGHELYDGLERQLSAEALSRRSKTLLFSFGRKCFPILVVVST